MSPLSVCQAEVERTLHSCSSVCVFYGEKNIGGQVAHRYEMFNRAFQWVSHELWVRKKSASLRWLFQNLFTWLLKALLHFSGKIPERGFLTLSTGLSLDLATDTLINLLGITGRDDSYVTPNTCRSLSLASLLARWAVLLWWRDAAPPTHAQWGYYGNLNLLLNPYLIQNVFEYVGTFPKTLPKSLLTIGSHSLNSTCSCIFSILLTSTTDYF